MYHLKGKANNALLLNPEKKKTVVMFISLLKESAWFWVDPSELGVHKISAVRGL